MLKGIILDLDGTVYRGTAEVPGASKFVRVVRAMGIRCAFVTNRANRTPEEVCRQLRGHGVACCASDVVTSAQAAAAHLRRGSAYVVGEEGLRRELRRAGIRIARRDPDYVVASLDRSFDYAKLTRACRFIRAGARFIATNRDKGLPVEDGILPGSGAIVAAIAAGSGQEPLVIGKPNRAILDLAIRRLGVRRGEVIAVGDNVETDMPAGQAAGIRTVLMLTGMSRPRDLRKGGVRPDWVVKDYPQLLRLVRRLRG